MCYIIIIFMKIIVWGAILNVIAKHAIISFDVVLGSEWSGRRRVTVMCG